ncbi:MAG: metallophosphoesterase family protein [Victivallales bacterium]|nr:metallophosphoesterase family protein [Victivallales bacterium]
MLFGIIGDIHGNIDALEAVYARLMERHVDKVYCTGDIVGYGAAPSECIEFIRSKKIATVIGNHDWHTAFPERESFGVRDEAMQVFKWNRKMLSQEQLSWLASLPMVLEENGMIIRHGSSVPYPEWDYVISVRSAAMHFLFQHGTLCFNGHSHVPVLSMHRPGCPVIFSKFRNMILPNGMDIMVGVGAVGQPRDSDSRACCVLYDDKEKSISSIRVEYDIGMAQRRIFEAKLPEVLAYRLAAGR